MQITRRGFLMAGAMLMLSGCGGNNSTAADEKASETDRAAQEQTATSETAVKEPEAVDFDGTGMTEAGDFTFYVSTPGGTTEDGNVPQVVYKPGTFGVGIAINVENGPGAVCTVYIDGHKRKLMNAGHEIQFVDFEDSDATEGRHKVELVSNDDNGASIYKFAEYEIVLDV